MAKTAPRSILLAGVQRLSGRPPVAGVWQTAGGVRKPRQAAPGLNQAERSADNARENASGKGEQRHQQCHTNSYLDLRHNLLFVCVCVLGQQIRQAHEVCVGEPNRSFAPALDYLLAYLKTVRDLFAT